MKAIKMIGLAALTALMAMAFVGATAAMAENTSLCTADENPCAAANQLPATSAGKAKLLTSFGTVECNVLFSGTIATKLASPLVISGSFTYTECQLGETKCTAAEENGPAEIKVVKESHETAKVTGEGLVHLVCGKSVDCSYNGEGLAGTARGPLLSAQTPDNGEVSLSEQATTKEAGGFLCPKTAKLDITMTPLTATYITGTELTALCSVDENPCATANQVGSVHETSVGAGSVHETSVSKAKLLTSLGTAECNVLFSGTIATKLANPLVISGNFTYTNCALGGSSCTATEENGPAQIKVLKEGHETAKVTYEFLVHVVCGASIDCSYNGTNLVGTDKGPLLSAQTPDNGEVTISEQSLTKEAGSFLCPKTAKLDITTTPLTATYISS